MSQTDQPTQQPRSERIGLAVTAREKRAVEFVALTRNMDAASLLLRDMSLAEIVTEYDRLRLLIGAENDAPAARSA